MTTTLLLRSARAEAQTLRDEVDALREVPGGRRRLLEDAEPLTTHCREYPAWLRRQWDSFQRSAEGRIFVGDDLDPVFTLFLSLAEACLTTITAVRQGLDEAEPYRGEVEAERAEALPAVDLAALDAAAAEVRAFSAEMTKERDWFRAPPPAPRKLRTTAEIREGMARGEYMDIEDAFKEAIGYLALDLPVVEDIDHQSAPS
jgi:hypothetical protein